MTLDNRIAKRVVEVLNRAFRADSQAIGHLFEYRAMFTSQELADDPTIQVRLQRDDAQGPLYSIGLLGLINGICGTMPESSSGYVAANYEVVCSRHSKQPKAAKVGDYCTIGSCRQVLKLGKLLGFVLLDKCDGCGGLFDDGDRHRWLLCRLCRSPSPGVPSNMTGARISDCGVFRYTLDRPVPGALGGSVLWIMLNPSTADAAEDDATIRKVIGFSHRCNYDTVRVVNLFAWRATDPRELCKNPCILDVENLRTLLLESTPGKHQEVIFAWGGGIKHANKELLWVVDYVKRLFPQGRCLGLNKDGTPKHPLYVPYAKGLRPLYTPVPKHHQHKWERVTPANP